MSMRPAKFTQADVARAIRAAKKEGAAAVDIKPDGTISVQLSPSPTGAQKGRPADSREEEDLVL